MSNRFCWLWIALAIPVIYWGGDAQGQEFLSLPIDTTVATPAAPFLQKPDPIAYTVTFNYKDAAAPPSSATGQESPSVLIKQVGPKLKSMAVDRVGDLRHDLRQWDRGEPAQADFWYSQAALFKDGKDAMGNSNGIRSEPAFAKGVEVFPELNWVGKNNFVGVIRRGERVINVYRYKFVDENTGGFNPIFFQNEEVTAYIDAATQLPLAAKAADYVLVYTYRSTPSSLNPPEEYLAAFQKYRDRKARGSHEP